MMMPEDELNWDSLDRYLSGRCTAEESAAMREWAAGVPSRAELLSSVARIWEVAGRAPERFDGEAAVRTLRSARSDTTGGLRSELVSRAQRGPTLTFDAFGRRARSRWASLAAAILLAVMSGAAWHWRSIWRTPELPVAVASREFATRPGQRAQVLLPDGTRVWLNVDSRLFVPADYGTRGRSVRLKGEGYFAVVHDPKMPFSVSTAHAVIRDVGTEFVIRSYNDDTGTAVTVAQGNIALSTMADSSTEIPLERGQRAEVSDSGHVNVTSGVDVDAELEWLHGRLSFEHARLSDAIRDLDRWYGVKITLADPSMGGVIITASLGRDSLDDALRVLSGTLGVRYERHGTLVRLLSSGAPR
ncbi:MAG: FecR family protein [Gemmatimonadaceae bacterium]